MSMSINGTREFKIWKETFRGVYICSFLIIYLILNYIQAGKKAAILGVLDSKLSAAINEATEIKCSHIGVIPEVGLTNFLCLESLLL